MVSHCICCKQSFASALAVARKEECNTVAELQTHLYISKKCGLCIPFLQRVLETGETVVPLMSAAETAHWIARSGVEERTSGS